ncbi:hypothetical protein E4U37_004782 [Claviceps purpurea]|nr:hypothetical protein E4U37_004782 [Claviceps purpurea]
MAYDSSDADYSSEAELAAVERWIDPATGKPNYSRFTEHNLEERTLAAVELYRDAHYPNIKNAAAASKCHTIAYMAAIRAGSLYPITAANSQSSHPLKTRRY